MTGADLRSPSPWIVRFAPLIASGRTVLDLACGAGRHTRFLLRRGHAVTAVDRDVEDLSDLVGTANLHIVQADLEDGSPWPLPGQRFGAVVVTNYLWRPLLALLVAALEEHGILLYETFAVGDEAYRRPARPEFLLRPGELIEAVQGRLQIVAYEHGRVARPRAGIKQRLCGVNGTEPLSLQLD